MKILKEGREMKPMDFKCDFCKTEWEAEKGEYYIELRQRTYIYACKCPICNLETGDMIKNQEDYDGLFK